jgi:hypothetical protein
MKKEPIIYFPKSDEVPDKKEARVGEIVRIGKPSSRYYQYIYHSLNYNSHRLNDLQALLKLEGVNVKIISILKMRTGGKIAVLHRKDGKGFSANIEKLFASLEKAIDTEELNFF